MDLKKLFSRKKPTTRQDLVQARGRLVELRKTVIEKLADLDH